MALDIVTLRHYALYMDSNLSRAALVDAAKLAAYDVFFGRKAITEEIVKRAVSAGFAEITRVDRLAGTATHPCAPFSYGVHALAVEGAALAREMWDGNRMRNIRATKRSDLARFVRR